MKPRSMRAATALLWAALMVALLALAGVHADDATASSSTSKITPSPALAEAIANGDVEDPPAFTATPVEVDTSLFGSQSGGTPPAAASPTTSDLTFTPTPTGTSGGGETAVDTFQSSNAISNGNNGKLKSSNIFLIGGACMGCVGVIVVAVMFKRKANNTQDDDQEQTHDQQEQQRRTTTCMFENADFTPGKPSMDAILQDDRLTTGSSAAMLPVFSAADRMDMSHGVVRLSSPFGAKGVRISSPAGRGVSTTGGMEFNAERGGSELEFLARSTAGSSSSVSTDHVVQVKTTAEAEL